MNTLKLYWNERRKECQGTIAMIVGYTIALAIISIIENKPEDTILLWYGVTLGVLAHAVVMVLAHHVNKMKLITLLLAIAVSAQAQTTTPVESRITLLLTEPDNPQPIIIPALCVGAVLGGALWVGIRIHSKICNIQMNRNTNAANVITAPLPETGTANPVTSGCECGTAPAGVPMPLLLEHSEDGQTWDTFSNGMVTGEEHYVPPTGKWRITPMKIIATRDGMIVPPGTLETSVDLRTWTTVTVSSAVHTVTPEPNHFYRIR